ncbi:hypothetical protein NHP190012_16390 (plasmid) [Helicobacter sp. NHP19-012]|uniref:Helix-turn-helix domain-containing protein n=2 Tax=Helicobacter TaxID=209 RepID=A0ABM7SJ68_9HELI|nr:hypothetical protein [Helicobacter sp. NHP19-012]BCZ19997.1 hypothetical protein NHP190012_16390 [Helicobacter sp. NHP19-012]
MIGWRKEKKGPAFLLLGGKGKGNRKYLYPMYKLEEFKRDNPQLCINRFDKDKYYTLDDLSTRNANSRPGKFGKVNRSTMLKSLTSEPQWANVKKLEGSRHYFEKESLRRCLLEKGIDDDKISHYLSVKEAALELDVSVGQLHAWRRDGTGPTYINFGTVYLYPLELLKQYTVEHEPIKGGFGEHGCARELKVSIDTLRQWRKEGKGPRWCEIDGEIYYTEDEVKRFKNRQK